MTERLIDMKEALAIIGVSESTLYHYAAEKKIPHYKIGSRLLFKESELADWIESKAVKVEDSGDEQI